MKNFRLNRRFATIALSMTLMTTSLTGCLKKELAPEETYDVIDSGKDGFEDLTQIIDVPGEDFKLVMEFTCDQDTKRAWRVTSDKFLYYSMYTEGLPDNTEVYIDNVHIDTSIKSKYACMDGILQDSMDDRIHNASMIGFPISDDIVYYGINAIEGCNNDFIQGTFYGYMGYETGTIKQRRYTESDYKELGVYANKESIVIDLLIKGPNDKEYRNVSVNTDFLVNISDEEINYEKVK